jgi:hypothetical protein
VWSAGSEVLDIYVGRAEGGVARGEHRLFWQSHASLEAGLSVLFEHAAAERKTRWQRRMKARVWLSGALARPFLCGPVQGLRRWAEVEALAQAMAPDATGLAAPCAVQIETWPHPHAALAVAINVATRDAIEAAARGHGVTVQSIRPWWAAALNHVLAEGSKARLVAIADGDAMTLLGPDAGRFDAASAYVPAPSGGQADSLLARLALTSGAAPENVVRIRVSPREGTGAAVGVPFGVIAEGSP